MDKKNISKLAFRFVILVGVVNLFADMTYEGARSINGAFLASLGASAIIVSVVSGFGEFLGYVLRSIAGFFADKTHKYWVFSFFGYAINLLAVPALALSGNWPMAAVLIILERTGRAIRKPSMETMLSYTSKEMGSGWVFGLNEALDQFGATLGPLIVALVLFIKGGYKSGYAILLIPVLLCFIVLIAARIIFPKPENLEKKVATVLQAKGFDKSYWLYTLGGALISAGFADFALIAFHIQTSVNIPIQLIPIFYAIAMAIAGISALIFGKLLDKLGLIILSISIFISSFAAVFAFSLNLSFIVIGMILLGISLGVQEALLKAILSDMVSKEKRATAFGLFDTVFGIAWFLGDVAMGFLYTRSITEAIIFSVITQLLSLPVFLLVVRKNNPRETINV